MSLAVLHAPAWYPPYSTGGTETYVASLIRALSRLGVRSAIAIPQPDGTPPEYVHDHVPVKTYPVGSAASAMELRGRLPPAGLDAFKNLLNGFDVYHQHAMTRGCGIHHLTAARTAGLTTVLTAHVPSFVCLSGTMLELGRDVCNGVVTPSRCGSCWAQSRGVPRPLAWLLGAIPSAVSDIADKSSRLGSIATALSAKNHVLGKLDQISEFSSQADHVVAVCQWLYDALESNGVSRNKLILSRQGLDLDLATALGQVRRPLRNGTRFGFVGRWDTFKGVHVTVEAFLRLPRTLDAAFVIYGVGNDTPAQAYRRRIESLAKADERITILPPVPQHDLPGVLESLDALLVPSQLLETGPMVVLEAQAAHLPVLGSDVGGIKELAALGGVKLVPMADIAAWTNAMASFVRDHESCTPNFAPVRTMDMVAKEMIALYESAQSSYPQ